MFSEYNEVNILELNKAVHVWDLSNFHNFMTLYLEYHTFLYYVLSRI